ncbi:MAG: ABC transporter permease [Clostridiales bacterium]|nr:ABC transporter permease [Clostridiales bacterium]
MKKKSFIESFAAVPHSIWVLLFVIAPLVFVVYFAFTDTYGSFTFDNITMLGSYAHIFVLSVCFALIATTVCLLIGYPLAFFMSQLSPRTQKILVILLMLPMWVSLLIRTYSLMAIFDNGGLFNSLLEAIGLEKVKIVGTSGAVILGMVYDFLPYMVLPIYTTISKLDTRYFEAASDLGCNGRKTLFKVAIPLSVPGIVSGVTMVFVPSISTFYISQKLGGGSFDLIGDTIERQFQNVGTYNIGAAISLVMMILIIISVAVMNRFTDENDGEGGIIV